MNIKPLERVSPESLGIRSEDVMRYLDALEGCGTELHGIMIARHGKICAEGWWAPYSPLLRHAGQSMTKSYVSTAVGLLVTEGRLSVRDRVIDLLPEYMPENPCENLKRLTVRDLLCMGSGMRELTDGTVETWVRDFFALDFPDEPGTAFWYSGIITSVLGVIVTKISGHGLMDFLTPRLFEKIGIDPAALKWLEHPGGQEYGGGGLFSRTEDNLRLGLLYMNGGVWEGERILSEEWVREATSLQISNADGNPPSDENSGFGYQIWLSKVPGNYIFWGALGQYVLSIPEKDMVISIHQSEGGPEARPDEAHTKSGEENPSFRVFNRSWEFSSAAGDAPLPENPSAEAALRERLSRLCLPRRPCAPTPDGALALDGCSWTLEENIESVIPRCYGNHAAFCPPLSHKVPVNIEGFTLRVAPGEVRMDMTCAGKPYAYRIGTDGNPRLCTVHIARDLPDMVLASGMWESGTRLHVWLRFLETCYTSELTLELGENPTVKFREFAIFAPTGWTENTVKAFPA